MQSNTITFTMIKPAALSRGVAGKILDIILENGFSIKALKMVHLTQVQAETFYAVHKDRPFYPDLVRFMISGPVIAAVLSKEDAVNAYRKLIGPTDPATAEPGTIRALFGKSIQLNAVHGSDSPENAIVEASFFFSGLEWM